MNRYPNFWLTLLLAIILIPPFVLRTLSERLELYPSILLPSGATRIYLGDKNVTFNRISLWGKHEKNNTWKRINLETFWSPFPRQYFFPIVKNSLGLELDNKKITRTSDKFLINKVAQTMNKIWSDKITPDEVNDAKDWWRKKLDRSGYAPELRITSEKVTYNIETSKIIKIKTSDEKIFRLD